MPEYPEMEHYRRLLAERIAGQPITKVDVTRPKSINVPVETFERELLGRTVWFVERRGKMLLFHLDNGKRLLLHLMLGGLIRYESHTLLTPEGLPPERPDRSVQVTLGFPAGDLCFIGLRLGYLHLLTVKETLARLADLGPEPFDPRLTPDAFKARFKGKRGSFKTAFVDQHVIAGIGNCYADEIAFEAQVRPDAKLADIEPASWERLYGAMHAVLNDAVAKGGYMELPLTEGDTVTGGYNDHCRVYDRGGEACPRCGSEIVQTELNSRKLFFCPSCQKER
ncbi:DNA-(apurinic or apyrimidinic site) lyase [Paenibacillus sp. UNC496MF]|uniref:Fpg/Nei family DNA glycosylase n=1 Tax=Paenibacillus sp. UNC496MF TaxID=1502753 RepID=UPI0008EAD998|nr:DNA-formamidopyrimidine glycosylase family protein [Paenibacillus sp. UNC496MF]SFI32358.1 DNA-(apurinic or apyrimidinic site) lyase [Paenibacillus sp. UNC496MF]